MPIVVKERCPQDHPCPSVALCPANALSQDGFEAPAIDKNKCTDCGLCVNTCPYQALTDEKTKKSNPGGLRTAENPIHLS